MIRSRLHIPLVLLLLASSATWSALGENITETYVQFGAAGEVPSWAYFWGKGGAGTIAPTDTELFQGKRSGKFHYSFSVAGGYVVMRCGKPLPEAPKAIHFSIRGNASGDRLACRIIDRTGETFLYPLAKSVDWDGWRSFDINVAAPESTWQGNNNKVIDAPAYFALQVNGTAPGERDLYISDIRVDSVLTEANRFVFGIGSTKTGNIWFGKQGEIRLVASVRDRGAKKQSVSVTYRVEDAERAVLTDGVLPLRIPAGGAPATATITVPTHGRFGVLRVMARLFGADGTLLRWIRTSAAVVPPPKAHPANGTSPFGMNLALAARFGPKERDVAAALARSSGLGWSREQISWDAVEPVKGQYHWQRLDEAFKVARAHGIRILGLIGYSATWARRDTDKYTSPPRDPRAYGEFVRKVVERYKGEISHWEIWNEPDSPGFWPPKPNAVQYAALLKAGYEAAKQADPHCTVLTAGLLVGVNHPDNWAFLEKLYAAGARPYFDALAWHAYCDPRSPDAGKYAQRLAALREVMTRHGDGNKPIWMTEEGWATAPGNPKTVTEQQQADYLARAHLLALSGKNVKKFFWFLFRDGANREGDFDQSYGILNPDWTPKPAFAAYAALTSQLTGLRPLPFPQPRHGLVCRAFGDRDTEVVALWNGTNKYTKLVAPLPASTSLAVLDEFGNSLDARKDGRLEIVAGPSPVYLRGTPSAAEALQQALKGAELTETQPPETKPTHTLVLEDFEHVGWGTKWKLGWMGSGHEGTVLTSSTDHPEKGLHCGRLDYRADPAKGKYGLCYVEVDRKLLLPEGARRLALWVYGDGSSNPVALRVVDASGETLEYVLANKLDWQGWRRLEVRLDKPSFSYGGDKDGRATPPLTFQGLVVNIKPKRKTSGVLYVDELAVEY